MAPNPKIQTLRGKNCHQIRQNPKSKTKLWIWEFGLGDGWLGFLILDCGIRDCGSWILKA